MICLALWTPRLVRPGKVTTPGYRTKSLIPRMILTHKGCNFLAVVEVAEFAPDLLIEHLGGAWTNHQGGQTPEVVDYLDSLFKGQGCFRVEPGPLVSLV